MLIQNRHLLKMGKKGKVLKGLEEKAANQADYEVAEFKGLDIEPEDRDVGIMGATFVLSIAGWFDKNNDLQKEGLDLNLVFGEDEFCKLLDILKPHFERQQAEDKWAKEEELRWKEEQDEKETSCKGIGDGKIRDAQRRKGAYGKIDSG